MSEAYTEEEDMLGWKGLQLEIFVIHLNLPCEKVLRVIVLRTLCPVVWTRSLVCPSGILIEQLSSVSLGT